jgi:hypothetical protein
MSRRYNPPPNWPTPPAGWTPPEGWQPDPAWGPAPEGWPLWVEDQGWLSRHKVGVGVGAGVLVLVLILCCGVGVASLPGSRKDAAPGPSTGASSSSAPRSPEPTPSPTPAARVTVPKVVGQHLDDAVSDLEAVGLTEVESVDASGRGRAVLVPQNWVVQSQTPGAGSRVDATTVVTLKVLKPSDETAAATATPGVVPRVVCMDLQTAQDTLQATGYHNLGSEDATGQGRAQLVDRNWVVVGQSERAGSSPPADTRIVLRSVKYGEPTGDSHCPS